MFPRLPACATFVADTKNVSDFIHKHFVSATNVFQFAQPKKHHEQQCVHHNVSSFASTFKVLANEDTLLRTHCCRHKCFPVCPRAQHLLRTQILCPGHKMFLILFRNILCSQQMFPSLRAQGNVMSKAMFPQQCVLVCHRLYRDET